MKYFYNILLFFFFTLQCFSQVLSNYGSVINIVSGAGVKGSSIYNSTGTIINTGTLSLSSDYNNSANTAGAGNYFIGGNWANTGTFTAGAGAVVFNGAEAQSIGATTFSNVTFSGGNTKTLNGNLNILTALTLNANTTLALASANITLRSDTSNTARVAAIAPSASITYGTGKFIVQRYIMGRRKYRLITSAVTTSTGTTLSAGQEALSIWGNWQNQGNNTTANSGTIISGGSSADGFDQQTTNASLYTYDGVNRKYVGFSSANSKKTKYAPLKAGVCYYMFVYGDRINSVGTNSPNYTVLSAAGTILTGDQVYNTSSAIPLTNTVDNYTMLGNPFASPIDWATITKSNLYNTFWGWDPNLSSTGGYVTVSTAGAITLISPFTGTTGIDQYIQSGQGFFVRTSAASPVLTIKESDKVARNNTNAFRTTSAQNDIPLIAVNLYDNNHVFMDGALSVFSNTFSNGAGKEDAAKIFGVAEGVSIGIGTELLSIDARQMPGDKDTLFLKFARLTKPKYTLQIFANRMDTNTAHPYLQDNYLHTVQLLSVRDTNTISFNITTDAASSDANRFRIVFSASNISPVSIIPVASELKIFPNPVKDRQINIHISELSKGSYVAILTNSQGQQMFSTIIIHPGGALHQIINPGKNLPPGIYYFTIATKKEGYTKTIFIE